MRLELMSLWPSVIIVRIPPTNNRVFMGISETLALEQFEAEKMLKYFNLFVGGSL